MAIETILPRDKTHWLELRKPLITSTEVAALFDCSPYFSKYELYHRKHDNLEIDFTPSERMSWGLRLETAIAQGVAEDNGWNIRKMDEFIFDAEERVGASFDFAIGDDGILEIKNVDSLAFRDGWIVDGDNIEGPAHIEFQIQTQLYLSNRKYAMLAGLIGGNRVVLIKREPDGKVIEAIRRRVREFWISVGMGVEPRPDYQRDAGIIARLYAYAEPGKLFNADGSVSKLASQYRQATKDESEAKSRKDAAKAEILTLVGNAEKVLGENFTISAGMQGPVMIEAYERKGFRTFRINWKKETP